MAHIYIYVSIVPLNEKNVLCLKSKETNKFIHIIETKECAKSY